MKWMPLVGTVVGARVGEMVPLSRRDIADHLGTTPETLSRNMQILARSKVIRIIDAKQFELLSVNELIKHSGESRADLARIASV